MLKRVLITSFQVKHGNTNIIVICEVLELLRSAYLVHLHAESSDSLHVLRGEVSLPVLLALGQSDIQRLGDDDAAVHFSDGLSGLFRCRETDEAEALGPAFFAHDLGRGDGAVRSELLQQTLVSDGIVQVLDVQVNTLEPAIVK